ncbi:NAD(P)-dependent alcohol dehydrogenase [Algoriphagus chordae]|uniref:NADPH:quinone reductase-like Zn-dependent oxidoreductase n=1 Tax=Algoriphagus chordae TaxID=237019 RepID=A0A2W7QN17_9BACT|nr:NAD(P)-dependent alcohol dehydrogenase [Algoriphagus chordae]PZX47460.1 NADPH:quinone reductase-like Zn-dependent oxidoreductase [Algoriphagus chordae]
MKAAIRRSYGSPKSISVEEVDQPVPKDSEILIRVHATTVNRTDCANLTAKPFIMRFLLGFFKPRKIILGTDFAGEVVSVGKDVNSFKPNERVFGFTDMGLESQAEYLVVTPKDNILTIPTAVDYHQAAASLEGAHYAYTFIHKTSIQAGNRILINGASGGIGSALLQFCNTLNVHITATCDTKNIALIKSLGANKIIDYTQEDFTQDDEKYDFIFDAVGKSTFGKCKPLLKKGGTYISSELGPYSQNVFYAIIPISTGDKKVVFPIPYSLSQTLPYIKSMLEKGKFKPVIDREYPLKDITDAYTYVISGQKTGNVVINL